MTTNHTFYSDLAISPGEYLAEVLELKGVSQAELARRMGRPISAINEIIKGDKIIMPETALQLEQVLGVPAHVWTGLEAQCQLVNARANEEQQLKRGVPILEQIPYGELARMGFVARTRNLLDKVRELQRFFGVSALSNMPQVKAFAPAFRCSGKRVASPYALAAWLKCGEIRGRDVETKPHDRKQFIALLTDARKLTLKPPEVFEPSLKKMLSDAGVAMVMLPHLKKTYVHGATFWLTPEKAVLMMSIRGSWTDIFWFSLFHELSHILLHNKQFTFIEDGNITPEAQKQEEEANRFAGDQLIPAKDYITFLKFSPIRANSICSFAKEIGIHPGIIVGRLQHDGKLPIATPLNQLRTRLLWQNSAAK